MNTQYAGVTEILSAGDGITSAEIQVIMEDAENPLRKKTLDKLYASLREKGHVDFKHIEDSEGDIKHYPGFQSMMDTLQSLVNLNEIGVGVSKDFITQVNIVQTAINHIAMNAPLYKLAFIKKVRVIILEYNSLVGACIEGTTSLLYNFVDYTRNPSSGEIRPVLKDTKRRGDLFYIEQLRQFNMVVADGNYRKYLTSVVNNGTEYFVVDTAFAVGVATIATTVALSIVPITRKLIYSFQDLRRRITSGLELQAYYLELNETILENNKTLPADKKAAILKKQAALRLKFLRLADKLRVESARMQEISKKTLENDNGMLTIDGMRGEIDDSDFSVV